MKKTSVTLCALALFLVPSLTLGGIAVDAPSTLTGYTECRAPYADPQCKAVEYENDDNLASLANGFAQPAVALNNIAGFAPIHQPHFANDGLYGNGASWIGTSSSSWVKIDLGRLVNVNSLRFGRDRNGGFNDRDPGTIRIEVATVDNVYANGDDSNDGAEYTQVLPATALAIAGATTYKADFPPVVARYVKLFVGAAGAAIDEIEVTGPGACCTDGAGTQSECVELSGDECDAIGGLAYSGAGSLCVDVADCSALVVTMDSMSATTTSRGALVTWTTAIEIDTVGFRLLRETPTRPEKALEVLAPMIPAAGNGFSGATYQFLDNTTRPRVAVRYYLEDIDIFGKVTRHGPIELQPGARIKPRSRQR